MVAGLFDANLKVNLPKTSLNGFDKDIQELFGTVLCIVILLLFIYSLHDHFEKLSVVFVFTK